MKRDGKREAGRTLAGTHCGSYDLRILGPSVGEAGSVVCATNERCAGHKS